jgi:hypothetical protein
MTTTHLLISLGTTICVGIFLYFYLKKRTEKIEKKVNLMFQLIQEHEKQARQQAQIMISQKFDSPQARPPTPADQVHDDENDLISVSDDDYADSDDSEEVSDSESGRIKISNLKTPLALNGAEITANAMVFDLDKTKNTHSITEILGVSSKEETKSKNSEDSDSEEVSDNESQEEEEQHADEEKDNTTTAEEADDTEEKVKIIELGADDLDSITLEEGIDFEGDDAAGGGVTINYEEIKQEVDSLVQNITLQKKKAGGNKVETVTISGATDLSKLRVPELKAKCGELGLEGYKSLRKSALIELLASNRK